MTISDENSIVRIKSFFQFGIVNILRNLLGVIRSKVVALWFGVGGIGIIGQYIAFFNLQSKVIVFGATASMVNSYHMAQEKNWDTQKLFFYHLLIIIIVNTLFTFLYIFNLNFINNILFNSEVNNEFLILILVVGILYSFSTYLEMIIQAQKKFKVLSAGRNFSIIVGLVTCIPCIYYLGLSGILYNLCIVYILSFIFFIFRLKNERIISYRLRLRHDIPILRYIIKVSIIDLLRSFMVIGSLLIGKIIIVKILGMIENGHIQSIWSISNYINVLSTGFMVYYFPIINSKKNLIELQEELNSSFELLIYLLFPLIIIILMFPTFFITLLYTKEFLSMSEYLKILMLAKFLELYYYFYTINFLGRSKFRQFIFLEGWRSVFFILITWFLTKYFQTPGAIWSILLTEVLSVFIVQIILRKELTLILDKQKLYLFLKMLLLLIILVFPPISLLIKILILIMYSILFLNFKFYLNFINLKR